MGGRMKKLTSIILCLVLIMLMTGCSKNAKMAVESYLDKYNSLDPEVVSDIDRVVDMETMNEENKQTYLALFKKQYMDLQYEILAEEYAGDEAVINVKVSVYDFYKVQKESSYYLANHADEFNDENGVYDAEKYINYKLDKMKMTTDRVEYTIDFYVVRNNNKWEVSNLSNSDLEKIHGIYNYES